MQKMVGPPLHVLFTAEPTKRLTFEASFCMPAFTGSLA